MTANTTFDNISKNSIEYAILAYESTGGMASRKSAFAWSDLSLARRERKEGNYTGDFTETAVAGVKVIYIPKEGRSSIALGTAHLVSENQKI